MTPAEVAAKLQYHNNWRRGHHDEQPDPCEISEAIDAAVEMIERLEAAEKSDAESLAMYRRARDELDALRAMLMVALDVLEDVKGNINPERGYADELEADVECAIAAIHGAKGE